MHGSAETEQINGRLVALIVCVATIGGFMFGYDSGVINGTQNGLESAFALGRLGVGVNVGAILFGSAIGAFVAGRMADKIGRRNVMIVSAVLFLFSAGLAGAAGSSAVFIIARIIGGLGVGAASVVSPIYIAEIVPAHVRGRLLSVQQVMIIAGLTGAFIANYLIARNAGGSTADWWFGVAAWRWMFWLQGIPAALYLILLQIIPESPRYLVIRGREAEAAAIFSRLSNGADATDKVAEIRESLAADHHRPKLSDLLEPGSRRIRPIVWTAVGLAAFQQLVGINIIFYYGATLWQAVGFSEGDALLTNVISGVLSIGSCLLTIALVDRIGRKPLMLVGSVGMFVTLATVAYAFSTADAGPNGGLILTGNFGILSLVAANLYVCFFNMSWGPVLWVLLGEIFPNQIRGSGLAVAGFTQWTVNALVCVSFPSLVQSPGLVVTYLAYATAAALSFFFVRSRIRETRGIELEDMQA